MSTTTGWAGTASKLKDRPRGFQSFIADRRD